MQRSQVKEFSINRSVYNAKTLGSSNIFSPSTTQRELHLRKSRIVNIPQNKKLDLCSKLQFIIIFQSIQIQRLSQQIQSSRSKLRNYQNKLFNSQNYEIQIKQLTQKCCHLQNQKDSYHEQLIANNQSNLLIFNQYQEIKKKYKGVDFSMVEKYKLEKLRNQQLVLDVEKWKMRYNQLDQSKSKELNLIKHMMEEQRRNTLSKQTKEIFQRFQHERQAFEHQIKQLKKINIQKQTQLKKIKFELDNADRQRQQLDIKVDEYEQKIALFAQQNYRLNQLVKSKQCQLLKSKQSIANLTQTIQKLSSQQILKNEQSKSLSQKLLLIQNNLTQKQFKLTTYQKQQLNDKEKLMEMDRLKFLLQEKGEELMGKNKVLERKDRKILQIEGLIVQNQRTQSLLLQQIYQIKLINTQINTQLQQLIKRINQQAQKVQYIRINMKNEITFINNYLEEQRNQTSRLVESLQIYSNNLLNKSIQHINYISQLQEQIEKNNIQIKKYTNEISNLLKYQQNFFITKSQNIKLHQIINQFQVKLFQLQQNGQRKIEFLKEISLKQIQQKQTSLNLILQTQKKRLNQLSNKTNYQVQLMNKQLYQKKQIINQLEIRNQKQKCQYQLQIMQIINRISSQKRQLERINQNNYEHIFQIYKTNYQLMNQQINRFYPRLQLLQKMLIGLKNIVTQKIKSLHSTNHQQINNIGLGLEQLMVNINNLFQSQIKNNIQYALPILSLKQSPSFTFPSSHSNQNHNISNFPSIGSQIKQTIKRQNIQNQLQNYSPQRIQNHFMFRFVLLCAEVEQLRKRIGDKNAKVQHMRNSIISRSQISQGQYNISHPNRFANDNARNLNAANNSTVNMQGTIIDNLKGSKSPFSASIIMSSKSIFTQSRLIQSSQSNNPILKRYISQDRFISQSPQTQAKRLDKSMNKTNLIYTNKNISIGKMEFKTNTGNRGNGY